MKKRIFAAFIVAAIALTGCAHVHYHDDVKPTCTEGVYCKSCGYEMQPPNGHSFGSRPISVTPGTCQTPSMETYQCRVCKIEQDRVGQLGDHTPGKYVITEESDGFYPGKRESYCVDCGEFISTEDYELDLEEMRDYLRKNATTCSFNDIARDPTFGDPVVLTGEVIQVIEEGDFYQLRVNITLKGDYYKYYDDTIYVSYTKPEGSSRILEDDIITFYGYTCGTMTYDSIFGQQITIPWILAYIVELNN